MFCNKCGKQLADDARFCTGCGAPVVRPIQMPVQQPYQPPVQQYQPPVQQYQPPVQQYQPPVQQYQPPVQQYQPPVQQYQPPVQQYQPPVEEPVPAPVVIPEPAPVIVPEPVVEETPVVAPVAEPVVEKTPVVAPVAEPVVEETPVVAPVAEPVVEETPVVAPVAEPVVEETPVVAPVAEPVVEEAPVVAPVAEPVVEAAPVEEPCQHPAAEQYQQFLQYQEPTPQYQEPVPQYQTPVQEQYGQPVQETQYLQYPQYPTPQPETVPQPEAPVKAEKAKKRMGKLKFVYVKGGVVSWISFAVLLIATALIGWCLKTALSGSILELPVVSMITNITPETSKELTKSIDDAKDYYEQGKKEFDPWREQLPEHEQELADKAETMLDAMVDFIDEPSLRELQNFAQALDGNADVLEQLEIVKTYEDAEKLVEQTQNLADVVDIVIKAVWVCFGLAMLLTFLAAMFRNTVLTVFGMIVSVLICLPLASVPLALAVVVLDIAAIVLNMILSAKYRKYRIDFVAA